MENEILTSQLQQLDNLHSYSVGQVATLSNDNLHLYSQQESLTNMVSQLRYDLMVSNMLKYSLSDENQAWLREASCYIC